MRWLLAILISMATVPAWAYGCSHGKQPNTFCKACKDLTITTIAHKNVGANGCELPCTSYCGWKPNAVPEPTPTFSLIERPEQPDPRRDPMRGMEPSILDGLYDEKGYYCGPIPHMKPWNYYALEATDAQILALAKVSPPAAWAVALSQIGGVGLPAPFEVSDGSHAALINEAMVKLLLRDVKDEAAFNAASPPLSGDVVFLNTSRVDRLRSGRRLIVVETELLHGPTLSTVGIPYPPFGIEIERVAGRTIANEDEPSNPARVWRVVSWGEPASYYR